MVKYHKSIGYNTIGNERRSALVSDSCNHCQPVGGLPIHNTQYICGLPIHNTQVDSQYTIHTVYYTGGLQILHRFLQLAQHHIYDGISMGYHMFDYVIR